MFSILLCMFISCDVYSISRDIYIVFYNLVMYAQYLVIYDLYFDIFLLFTGFVLKIKISTQLYSRLLNQYDQRQSIIILRCIFEILCLVMCIQES